MIMRKLRYRKQEKSSRGIFQDFFLMISLYFYLFYKVRNNIYQRKQLMSRWYICDGDSKSAQWQRQSDSYFNCNLFQQSESSHCVQSKRKSKMERKPSLKTSLSEMRLNQKNKQRQQMNSARTPTRVIPQYSPKQIPVTTTYVTYQKYPLPKMPPTNIKTIQFNTQVCQAYCTYPKFQPSPAKNYPQKVSINRDVKINYLPSMQPSTNVGINVINRRPIVQQNKNLIILPSKINSQVFIDNRREAEKRQKAFQLSKSMGYKQVGKIQKPVTTNLEQIDCIKAQSIPDSQQNSEQVSYVLQSQTLNFKIDHRL